ncbi:MAG: hypothetical protein HZA92_11210 [Verrucomicrobia bacterium]|nr:hypothetical protein [Verrucomicrobiota bacterium]
MSGPKCVVVMPLAPALPLVPILLVAAAATVGTMALVNLTSAYLERRKLEARFRRNKDDLASITARLRSLGEESDALQENLDELSRKADALMQQGQCEQAVALLASSVAAVDHQRRLLEARIVHRIGDLQRRFLALSTRGTEFAAARQHIESFARTATPSDWPAAERERIAALCRAALAPITVPAAPAADLSETGALHLSEAEEQMVSAERELEKVRQTLSAEINRTQSRLMADRLGINAARTTTLADWLAAQPPATAPPSPAESGILKKLDALLAQIGALQDTAGWAELMRRADAVRAETDAPRRRRLYESLVLESGQRLKQLRATQAWLAEVDTLIEESEPYSGTAVDTVAAGLRDLHRAGRPEDLTPWRERLASAQQRELARLEHERKRHAILESLAELGYETSEGMETALAQAGKLVIRKPGDPDYAVEVVSDASLSMVQTTMVRYTDAPEMTEQQRRRDCEREEEWCADHARLRDRLAKQGLATSFKLKLPSGEHPVKVVRQDQRTATRAPAKRALQRPT